MKNYKYTFDFSNFTIGDRLEVILISSFSKNAVMIGRYWNLMNKFYDGDENLMDLPDSEFTIVINEFTEQLLENISLDNIPDQFREWGEDDENS